jgi:asparagine synthase (glutamine-hydrolysing)
LNDILNYSTTNSGLSELLRYADRNSMAHSREVRLPFLSHELVEFAFSLPDSYKIKDGWTKYILRKSMEPDLPQSITWRKDKIGYRPPQDVWMKTPKMKERIINSIDNLIKHKIIEKPVESDYWQYLMLDKLITD